MEPRRRKNLAGGPSPAAKRIRTGVLSAMLFLAGTGLFLGILGQVRASSREQMVQDTRAAFEAMTELVAGGISSGYFEWTEFRDALVSGGAGAVDPWLVEISRKFRFVESASVADRPPPSGPYRITGGGTRLKVEFPVADSEGRNVLGGKTGVVILDAAAVLRLVQSEPTLELGPGGRPFLYGLETRFTGEVLTPADLLTAVVLGLVGGAVPFLLSRREERFFYESKGLDTIIFLFENTEQYSANHSRHVAELTVSLGRLLGYRGRRLKDLRTAALLHDIGKIAVPREILTKPGALAPGELEQIRTHADASARILEYFDELAHLAPVVRAHHEKLDGTGYPRGLRGQDIPVESRIIAVADVFEALTGQRPYRSPFPVDRALAELRSMPLDQGIVEVLAAHLALRGGEVFTDRNPG